MIAATVAATRSLGLQPAALALGKAPGSRGSSRGKATPSNATPSNATHSNATPSTATPPNAACAGVRRVSESLMYPSVWYRMYIVGGFSHSTHCIVCRFSLPTHSLCVDSHTLRIAGAGPGGSRPRSNRGWVGGEGSVADVAAAGSGGAHIPRSSPKAGGGGGG